ncbi:hypothetical protein H8356DRAFT_327884 [Neocallimastix lanati (nom. inval.)]|nr:hypothetical protein H8356DRAFT_327884 [Neocallimastix sp. JGI-2020a]
MANLLRNEQNIVKCNDLNSNLDNESYDLTDNCAKNNLENTRVLNSEAINQANTSDMYNLVDNMKYYQSNTPNTINTTNLVNMEFIRPNISSMADESDNTEINKPSTISMADLVHNMEFNQPNTVSMASLVDNMDFNQPSTVSMADLVHNMEFNQPNTVRKASLVDNMEFNQPNTVSMAGLVHNMEFNQPNTVSMAGLVHNMEFNQPNTVSMADLVHNMEFNQPNTVRKASLVDNMEFNQLNTPSIYDNQGNMVNTINNAFVNVLQFHQRIDSNILNNIKGIYEKKLSLIDMEKKYIREKLIKIDEQRKILFNKSEMLLSEKKFKKIYEELEMERTDYENKIRNLDGGL